MTPFQSVYVHLILFEIVASYFFSILQLLKETVMQTLPDKKQDYPMALENQTL